MLCLQAPQSLIHTDTQEVDEKKNWLKVSALFKQGKSKIESSFPFACLSATALGEWETRRVCVTAEACKRS